MLCGEQLDFHPQIFSNNNEEIIDSRNIAENLELPRHISPEARSCVIALLENDPDKRLGSPNSPHGLIRDHPFFKAGRRIDWQEIDEGLFKSYNRCPSVKKNKRILSGNILSIFIFFRLHLFYLIYRFVNLFQL